MTYEWPVSSEGVVITHRHDASAALTTAAENPAPRGHGETGNFVSHTEARGCSLCGRRCVWGRSFLRTRTPSSRTTQQLQDCACTREPREPGLGDPFVPHDLKSITHGSPRAEATQGSTSGWGAGQSVVCPRRGLGLSRRREGHADAGHSEGGPGGHEAP